MKQLFSVLLIIFILLPGALYLVRERLSRTKLPGSFAETLFSSLFVAIAVSSLAGILLLQISRFQPVYLILLLALASLGLLFSILRQRTDKPRAPKKQAQNIKAPNLTPYLIFLVLAIAVALRLPPAIYAHGGQDQGVYLNVASHFARTGRIFYHDPYLKEAYSGESAAARALRKIFDPCIGNWDGSNPYVKKNERPSGVIIEGRFEGTRLPGFFIADKESGRIAPEFFHLHPMWLAVFSVIFGFAASVYMLPFFSILSLGAVYCLARRAFASDWAGLLAAGLLGVNILQVWTNRFPVSETLAQGLLFGALMLYYRWRECDDAALLWASAASFGLFAFTHGTALIFLPMFIAAFWLSENRRREYIFFNAIFLFNIYALCHAVVFSYPYLYKQFLNRAGLDFALGLWHLLALGISGIIVVNLLKMALSRHVFGPLREFLFKFRRPLLVPAGALFTLLPLTLMGLSKFGVIPPPAEIEGFGLQSPWSQIIQFGWYATIPGLLLAGCGVYFFARQKAWDKSGLLPFFCLFAIIAGGIAAPPDRYHFYFARYYTLALLPLALVFAALGAVRLAESRLLCSRIAGGLALAALLLLSVVPYFTNPAFRLREHQGSYAALGEMAEAIPPGSVTFVNSLENVPSYDFYVRNGTSLMFIEGRYVFPHSNLLDQAEVARILSSRGMLVNLLRLPKALPETVIDGEYYFEQIASGTEEVVFSEHVMGIPNDITKWENDWFVYRFSRDADRDMPITLVPESEIADTAGFYADPARASIWAWTQARAEFADVRLAAEAAPFDITIALAGYFPEIVNPNLRVMVNTEEVFNRTLTGRELKQTRSIGPIAVPAMLNKNNNVVSLEIEPWIPKKLGITQDQRPLGLDLASLVIQPRPDMESKDSE